MQQVIQVTASMLEEGLNACRSGTHRNLAILAAELHAKYPGPILLRLDFPGGDIGGVELRAKRGTGLGWLAWKLAGKTVRLWT